jgi:hypothetical protein
MRHYRGTVIATRLPNTMSESILTRQLGIQCCTVQDPDVLYDGRYQASSSDSFLFKNLNHFLANTALHFIRHRYSHLDGAHCQTTPARFRCVGASRRVLKEHRPPRLKSERVGDRSEEREGFVK